MDPLQRRDRTGQLSPETAQGRTEEVKGAARGRRLGIRPWSPLRLVTTAGALWQGSTSRRAGRPSPSPEPWSAAATWLEAVLGWTDQCRTAALAAAPPPRLRTCWRHRSEVLQPVPPAFLAGLPGLRVRRWRLPDVLRHRGLPFRHLRNGFQHKRRPASPRYGSPWEEPGWKQPLLPLARPRNEALPGRGLPRPRREALPRRGFSSCLSGSLSREPSCGAAPANGCFHSCARQGQLPGGRKPHRMGH